ncbi:MAG TPA: hypothetical protein VFE59_23230 [Trebonia sp.]|nr:hypothetical protein [Trebonia sp.]
MRIPNLLAAAVTLAVPAAAIGVTSASAATAPKPVLATLSACGSGSHAVWSGGNAILTVGQASAGECGAPANATYNPAYAQAVLQVKGGVVPATEPEFTTDNYASGSPRIVIDLGNGHSLVGYPAKSGLNGTDMAWAVDNGSTYTSYATAYQNALAYETTVKDAYVVEDADQTPGTADTITSFTYGGAPVEAMVTLSHGHVVSVNNNRAEVAWTATPAAAEYKVVINGPNFNMRTNVITATTAYYSGLEAGHTYAVYVTPLDANGNAVGSTGVITFVTTG